MSVKIAQSQEWTPLNYSFNSSYGFIAASQNDKVFTFVKYINESYEAMLSTDGGSTWNQVHDDRFEVAFFNTQEDLYATRQKRVSGVNTYYPHKVFLTTDDGNNWTTIDTAASNPQQVEGTVFRMDNMGTLYTGFRDMTANTGGFNYSTDDGESWTYVPTFIESQFDYRRPYSALLTSQGDLFITTYNSGIFKSVDDGITWARVYESFVSLAFLHEHPETGDLYAASISALLKSQDNGETWEIVEPDPWFVMNIGEFELTADGTFYIAGLGGIIKSTDGVSWELIWDPASKQNGSGVQDMAISNNYIYVVAKDSMIYRRLRSGTQTGLNDVANDQSLSIHPNPATHKINLNLDYKKSANANPELFITDINGRIVYEDVLPQIFRNYEVDVSKFNPGYYVIIVTLGTNMINRKLLISQ